MSAERDQTAFTTWNTWLTWRALGKIRIPRAKTAAGIREKHGAAGVGSSPRGARVRKTPPCPKNRERSRSRGSDLARRQPSNSFRILARAIGPYVKGIPSADQPSRNTSDTYHQTRSPVQ